MLGSNLERVLGVILEEQLTREELQKVPQALTLPIFELIRFVRQFTQELQGDTVWPEQAFRLIGREDILLNT